MRCGVKTFTFDLAQGIFPIEPVFVRKNLSIADSILVNLAFWCFGGVR